jgi:hypothetical protein
MDASLSVSALNSVGFCNVGTDLRETRPVCVQVESALLARLPAVRGGDGPTMGLGEGINRNGTSAATIDAALRATF